MALRREVVAGGALEFDLRPEGSTQLTLVCNSSHLFITASWGATVAPESYFKVLGRLAAEASKKPHEKVEELARFCAVAALNSGVEEAVVDKDGLHIECEASRDDGSLTMTVAPNVN